MSFSSEGQTIYKTILLDSYTTIFILKHEHYNTQI